MNAMAKVPVSVLVPTRNEEANIARCLACLEWADEVVVVDSCSADRTQEIARAAGASVLEFRWSGIGPRKRNWALDHHAWRNEWVLFLDADEEISPALRDEIAALVREPRGCDGFVVTSRFEFLGRVLRHGIPIRKLILCRHAVSRYERVDVPELTAYDMEIHEQPQVKGAVGEFQAELVHHHFEDLHRHFERHNVYSDWEALLRTRRPAAEDQPIQPRLFGNLMERRRWFKKAFLRIPGKSAIYFLYSYVLRAGFLDGRPGLIFNLLRAFYWFQIDLKVDEIERRKKSAGRAAP